MQEQAMQEKLKKFLKENGLTQATLGRSLSVSGTMISTYMKGTYQGDCKKLEKKLSNYIANYNPAQPNEMAEVVKTSNLLLSHFIIDELIISKSMGAIYGGAGSGKTTMIREYAKTHPEAIVIETIPGMNIRTVLAQIAGRIDVATSRNSSTMIIDIAKAFKMRDAILIIDEAENLTTNTLEAIRRIWDFSSVPTVFVGTYALLNNLKGRNGKLLQLLSRIQRKVEFSELSDEEWEMFFGEVGTYIKSITKNLRIAKDNIYNTAQRYAKMRGEELNIGHIKDILPNVMLDN